MPDSPQKDLPHAATGQSPHGSVSPEDYVGEENFWREEHSARPYAAGKDFDTLRHAYRYGMETYHQEGGRPFDELNDNDLQAGWAKMQHSESHVWDDMKHAMRDAYERLFETKSHAKK